jgi:hypothetical protein
MPKTKLERIASIEEQIALLKNQQKQLAQKHKADERKARTRRLCSRMGLFESMLPDTIVLTDEQFKTFLERTVANGHGRRELAKFATQGGEPSNAKQAEASPQGCAPAPSGGGDCMKGTG